LSLLIVDVLSKLAVERCEKLGMRKLAIPLGTPEDEPHTFVLVSEDFESNMNKVVVLVIALRRWTKVDTICARLGNLGKSYYG
jgi:hypothetical protein